MRRRDQDPLQSEANQPQASNTVGPVRVTAHDIQTTSVHRNPSSTSSKNPENMRSLFFFIFFQPRQHNFNLIVFVKWE